MNKNYFYSLSISALLLSFLFFNHTSAFADDCDAELTRPGKKTFGPGALFRLKPQLKKLVFKGTALGREPAASIDVYGNLYAILDGPANVITLYPGDEFRALSAYKKKDSIAYVEIELVASKRKAFMYWVDVYDNAMQVSAGTIPEAKPKPARLKFPDKMRMNEYDTLASQGQTWYGRPFAKVGDMVWIANHTRSMSAKSVGLLIALETPLTPGDWSQPGSAIVETLAGTKESVDHYNCNPLSEEEVAAVK